MLLKSAHVTLCCADEELNIHSHSCAGLLFYFLDVYWHSQSQVSCGRCAKYFVKVIINMQKRRGDQKAGQAVETSLSILRGNGSALNITFS